MKVLLFGRNGQVGRHLNNELSAGYDVVACDRNTCDLSRSAEISTAINKHQPQIIINAAAYTAVDKAETETELAKRINTDAPAEMATAAASIGAKFIHYSTDYVFNGLANKPYCESDTTDPQSVYGHTKLWGEKAIAESGAEYYILRTSWVFDGSGHNFLRTMLRLAETRDTLSVVADQYGAPTFAKDLAGATRALLSSTNQTNSQVGVYHASNCGVTTWHGFAQKIFNLAGKTEIVVNPIKTVDYPTPAARPAYSVLDNRKLEHTFNITLPPWEDAVERCMADAGLT